MVRYAELSNACCGVRVDQLLHSRRYSILETANLAHVLDSLAKDETAYDFAIQTGDAIDNVTEYVKNWRPFLNTVNSGTLGGVDMIHVLGNHEYYGDLNGEISGAVYDLPVSTQNSWYKMEYGKVCVVVVNNGTKLAEGACGYC